MLTNNSHHKSVSTVLSCSAIVCTTHTVSNHNQGCHQVKKTQDGKHSRPCKHDNRPILQEQQMTLNREQSVAEKQKFVGKKKKRDVVTIHKTTHEAIIDTLDRINIQALSWRGQEV